MSVITLPKVVGGGAERFRRKVPSQAFLDHLTSFLNNHSSTQVQAKMAKISSIVYYRVKPRWLMVKVVDENGEHGWGEATLEGHDLAVEGCLDEMIPRIIGEEAK